MHLLIADDHRLVSESLRNLLAGVWTDLEVSIADDIPSAMRIIGGERPVDFLLLDLNIPGMNRFERCMYSRYASPNCSIAVRGAAGVLRFFLSIPFAVVRSSSLACR